MRSASYWGAGAGWFLLCHLFVAFGLKTRLRTRICGVSDASRKRSIVERNLLERMSTSVSQLNLRLSRDVERLVLPDGVCLLKQTRLATYLTLAAEQLEILDCFAGEEPVVVQDVLFGLLTKGKRCHLREFYRLVLVAVEGGILVGDGASGGGPMPELRGHRWAFGWRLGPALGLFVFLLAAGAWAFASLSPGLPETVSEWGMLLLSIALCLSLGYCLSGCTLRGYGRLVYSPGIRFRCGVPHFWIDTRDAFMAGRPCQLATALMALTAPFLVAVVVYLADVGSGLVAAAVALLMLTSPFCNTPGHELIHAAFRRARRIPHRVPKFMSGRLFRHLFGMGVTLAERRYLAAYWVYVFLWLSGLFVFCEAVVRQHWDVWIRNVVFAPSPAARALATLGCAMLFVMLFVPLMCEMWFVFHSALVVVSPMLFSTEKSVLRKRNSKTSPSPETVGEFLARTPLFADLSTEGLLAVAQSMTFSTVKKGTPIVREGDYGDLLFVVYSGEVAVSKESDTGYVAPVARLGEGAVFGEIALLDRVPRTATVTAVGTTGLLVLPRVSFDELLLVPLGADRVRVIIQVCSFIKRNSMFSEWPDQSLQVLARQFAFVDFQRGQVVIEQDKPNDAFYLIYEGQCEVRRGDELFATLSTGDFFGEISLLRGVPAVATVTATTPSCCLKLGREEFLRFVTEDALTGIAIETTMEHRVHQDFTG